MTVHRFVSQMKWLVIAAVVVVGGAVAAPAAVAKSAKHFKGVIKIGIVSDLTGPSSIGSGIQGALAYLDQTNAAGGVDGYKIDATQYDSESVPADAVQAVRRLISTKPAGMIDASFSIGSAMPTLAASGIPSIGDGATPGWLGNPSLFSILGDQTTHESDARLVLAKRYTGATKIALIGSPYAVLAQKALVADAAEAGVQIVMQDVGLPLAPTSADFLSAAEQMKSSGAQAAIAIGIEGTSVLQVDLNQLNDSAKLITSDEWVPPTTSVDGLIFTDAWANPYVTGDPGIQAYKAAMKKFGYGSLVKTNVWTPLRWAQAALLVQGLEKAGPPFSHAKTVKALSKTKNFTADGVVPAVSFPLLQRTGGHCQAVMEVVGTQWRSLINGRNPFICGAQAQEISG